MNLNTSDSIPVELERHRGGETYIEEMAILAFTDAIVSRMEALEMTNTELAKKMGVSQAYVTKLVGGSNNFTLRTMAKVAKALTCELSVGLPEARTGTLWCEYRN